MQETVQVFPTHEVQAIRSHGIATAVVAVAIAIAAAKIYRNTSAADVAKKKTVFRAVR